VSRGELRILIVAEHASERFGGEAIIPLHYFRILRQRGIEVWLIAHERTESELEALFPDARSRIRFLRDTAAHRILWRITRRLPRRLGSATSGYALRLITQFHARREARRLIAAHGIQLVHQPIPVSPREPSALFGLGVPVVIGPMNGGMSYPPAFRRLESAPIRALVEAARRSSDLLHWVLPGKLRARVLLVANERTRAALPSGARGQVAILPENGVRLELWRPSFSDPRRALPERHTPTHFLYVGRLVDWKAVDLALEALGQARKQADVQLEIVGDGPERASLERTVQCLGLETRVRFSGWLAPHEVARRMRESDALVLPSLYECGGAVVLEAMACGLPVIATAWGGPADYLDECCGVLVPPTNRDMLVSGFADAMVRLAEHPELRARMGAAGLERVRSRYAWDVKVERVLQVYRKAINESSP